MAMLINGEHVPDALIEHELALLLKTQQKDADPARLKLMAACAVVDRVLVRQTAGRDSRPIDPAVVEAHMREQMRQAGCRAGVNETAMRLLAESELRMQRIIDEMTGEVPHPTTDEVMQVYEKFRHQFPAVERAEAAHIVVHVNAERPEAEARRLIGEAQAALESGVDFGDAAEMYSDCKGNGGALDPFERGTMVDEFEAAVFALDPGQRTGVFRTPFGFHIAELRAKSAGGPREPGVAQRSIEEYLYARRKHAAMQRGMDALRETAEIVRVSEVGETA